jgi:hypothetical protein
VQTTWAICFSRKTTISSLGPRDMKITCLPPWLLLLKAQLPEGYNARTIRATQWRPPGYIPSFPEHSMSPNPTLPCGILV